MKAHLVQFDIAWESPQSNYAAMRRLIEAAHVKQGDLIVLPEMCDTGFSFAVERTADQTGQTLAFFAALSNDFGVTVQGGRTITNVTKIPAPRAAGAAPMTGRNVMSVVQAGKLAAEYAKVHPFQREAERIERGTEVVTYHLDAGTDDPVSVCPVICYDLRFPELFRMGLRQGAEVFAIGACWPEVRIHHWRALIVARAIENQAYVIGVNRTGSDPFTSYPGATIAVGPRGNILGELKDQPGVLSIDIVPGEVRSWRAAFSAWKDGVLPPFHITP